MDSKCHFEVHLWLFCTEIGVFAHYLAYFGLFCDIRGILGFIINSLDIRYWHRFGLICTGMYFIMVSLDIRYSHRFGLICTEIGDYRGFS